MHNRTLLTQLKLTAKKNSLYILLCAVFALGFITLSYIVLRMDSSLGTVYMMTSRLYFYAYVFITIVSGIFFGINASFFTYQWQKFGIKNIFKQSGTGLSALLGIVASSCPVCGGTVLSLLAALSGLPFLTTAGLELKVLSFFLIVIATFFAYKETSKKSSGSDICPVPLWNSYLNTPKLFIPVVLFLVVFVAIDVQLWSSDSLLDIASGQLDYSEYACFKDVDAQEHK
ncbi:hypothetical protein KA078_00015 [Candidatus Woesebacteria bacterium]|nr:hypothetical protein [Candidatus Woesebacteria bacterium]